MPGLVSKLFKKFKKNKTQSSKKNKTPSPSSKKNKNPSIEAIATDNELTMEELIKKHDIKIPIGTPKANEDPPSGIGLKVWEAAFNGDYDTLERLVDEWNGNKVVLNWQYKDLFYKTSSSTIFNIKGSTPLIAASRNNCIKCIILLVNSSSVKVNLKNYVQETALFWAVQSANIEATEVLLKVKGIDDFDKPLEIAQINYNIYNMNKKKNKLWRYFPDPETELKLQKYSRIIKLLEKAIRMKKESYNIFSPRVGGPELVPGSHQRRSPNVFTPETHQEKLPTITLSIHGHGIEMPDAKLELQNYKKEKLDVRVYSAASELNMCGIHFYEDGIEKKIDDALVSALKNNSEMSSYDIIKETIEHPSKEYRKRVADLPIHSGKNSIYMAKAKFNADNTWHTYVPLWDKEYQFSDENLGNWIHVLNRKNIEGNVFNEDPNKLLNLINFNDAGDLFNQQLKACKTCYPKMLITPTTKIMLLSKIIDVVSSYGFKVINIIDHTCRSVETNRYSEEEIKKFHDDEKAQPINRAHGGKKKRKTQKNKGKCKSKTYKKITIL